MNYRPTTTPWHACISGWSGPPTPTSVLDVAYRTIDTPVGTLLLAATAVGLVRVAYDIEGHDTVLARLADVVSPRILRAPARLDSAAHQIDEYFAKRRTTFDVPVDLRLTDGFRRARRRAPARHRVRRPGELCRGRRGRRQPPSGTGRWDRLRPQSPARGDPMPSRGALRRLDGPIRRRTARQVDTARP